MHASATTASWVVASALAYQQRAAEQKHTRGATPQQLLGCQAATMLPAMSRQPDRARCALTPTRLCGGGRPTSAWTRSNPASSNSPRDVEGLIIGIVKDSGKLVSTLKKCSRKLLACRFGPWRQVWTV